MKKATSKRPPRPRPPVTPPDPPPSMESGLDSEMLHRSPSPQRSYSGHSQRSSRSPSPPHRRRYSGARDDAGRGRSRSPSSRGSRRSGGHRTRSRTPPGGSGGRESGGRGGSRRDPRDKSQLVVWNNPVVILGEKMRNTMFHFCDECDHPILVYGRMIPCKHVFCLPCSTRAQQDPKQSCPRCGDKINRLEKCTIGSIYMCHYGGTQNGYTGCRRTYLSQRDLQAHVDTRHTKSTTAVPSRAQPSPVSQQAAAIAAVAAAVGPPAPNTSIRPPPLGSVPNPSLPQRPPPMTAAGFVNPPPVLASTAFPPPMRPPPAGPAGAPNPAAPFTNPPGGMAPRPPQGAIFSSAPPGLVANQPGMQASGGNGQPNWPARPPRPPF